MSLAKGLQWNSIVLGLVIIQYVQNISGSPMNISTHTHKPSPTSSISSAPNVQYEVIDVANSNGNINENNLNTGETTRFYTTGDVDDAFWLKHLGEDFKRAIHLQVDENNNFNYTELENGNIKVEHDYSALEAAHPVSVRQTMQPFNAITHFAAKRSHKANQHGKISQEDIQDNENVEEERKHEQKQNKKIVETASTTTEQPITSNSNVTTTTTTASTVLTSTSKTNNVDSSNKKQNTSSSTKLKKKEQTKRLKVKKIRKKIKTQAAESQTPPTPMINDSQEDIASSSYERVFAIDDTELFSGSLKKVNNRKFRRIDQVNLSPNNNKNEKKFKQQHNNEDQPSPIVVNLPDTQKTVHQLDESEIPIVVKMPPIIYHQNAMVQQINSNENSQEYDNNERTQLDYAHDHHYHHHHQDNSRKHDEQHKYDTEQKSTNGDISTELYTSQQHTAESKNHKHDEHEKNTYSAYFGNLINRPTHFGDTAYNTNNPAVPQSYERSTLTNHNRKDTSGEDVKFVISKESANEKLDQSATTHFSYDLAFNSGYSQESLPDGIHQRDIFVKGL